MSMPLEQQSLLPPPPPSPPFSGHRTGSGHGSGSGSGSVGPVIVVLVVITILGIIAGMVGRLCSGRGIMGRGQFDFEGWIERKCSSCIDGRVDSRPPTSSPNPNSRDGAAQIAVSIESPQEIKQAEHSNNQKPSAIDEKS